MKIRRVLALLAVTLCGWAAAPAQAGTLTGTLQNAVYSNQNGVLQPVDADQLGKLKFLAFYYSAHWCPSCCRFTPELVDFYNKTKKNHPEFEVIFVSNDHSREEMLEYMKTARMPWLATEYHKIPQDVIKLAGKYIPCLVLTDENGAVLGTSYEGEHDLGPRQVLDEIEKRLRKFKNTAGASASNNASGFDDFFKKPAPGATH